MPTPLDHFIIHERPPIQYQPQNNSVLVTPRILNRDHFTPYQLLQKIFSPAVAILPFFRSINSLQTNSVSLFLFWSLLQNSNCIAINHIDDKAPKAFTIRNANAG